MKLLWDRKAFVTGILVLYLVALFLPAFDLDIRQPVMGYEVLTSGWLGVLSLDFAWYANIALLLFLASLLTKRPYAPTAAAFIGLALAVSMFKASHWGWGQDDYDGAEITSFGTGAYLWLGVMVVTYLWCLSYNHRVRVAAIMP